MDLRLIAYFVAVVDHGGITRAAQALYLAQPSLSQAVQALERQLGVALFDRSGRGVVLTADGRAFAEVARRILDDVERARTAVAAIRNGAAGRLVVAALPTIAVDPLPGLAARLRSTHPGLVLSVTNPGSTAAVLAEVRDGTAEVGFTELPVTAQTLISRTWGTQEFVLALPPALAAVLPDPVPVVGLARIPLVMEPPHSATRIVLDAALGPLANEAVVIECAHRPAIWRLVQEGAGATLLPRGLAERELEGTVVRSTTPKLSRTIGIVHRPGPLSPAAQAFLTAAGLA